MADRNDEPNYVGCWHRSIEQQEDALMLLKSDCVQWRGHCRKCGTDLFIQDNDDGSRNITPVELTEDQHNA